MGGQPLELNRLKREVKSKIRKAKQIERKDERGLGFLDLGSAYGTV